MEFGKTSRNHGRDSGGHRWRELNPQKMEVPHQSTHHGREAYQDAQDAQDVAGDSDQSVHSVRALRLMFPDSI
jgi:hypothetical protein